MPVLTGRTGAAYNDVDPRAPYGILKQAILKRYEVTPEASRVKLRQLKFKLNNDIAEQLKFKLNDDIAEHISVADALARRWLTPARYNRPGTAGGIEATYKEGNCRVLRVGPPVLTGPVP